MRTGFASPSRLRFGIVGFAFLLLSAWALAGAQARTLGTATHREIAYPGNGNVYLINANGTERQLLVAGSSRFRVDHWGGIAWTHDSASLAFTVGNHRAGAHFGETLRLYVADGEGGNAHPMRGTPLGSFDPTWSPDGKRIAFAIRHGAETGIAVVNADGSGFRRLAGSSDRGDFYWVPDWSPDGKWILFEITTSPVNRLMAVRPDGSGLRQVATIDTGNHCICGDWSPDGTRIAFQAPGAADPDYPEIWVMNADATHRVQLTRNVTRDENPDWSPDGKWIAFYSERAGNAEIFTIPASGGQARRVTHDAWYDGPPRWRPPS